MTLIVLMTLLAVLGVIVVIDISRGPAPAPTPTVGGN